MLDKVMVPFETNTTRRAGARSGQQEMCVTSWAMMLGLAQFAVTNVNSATSASMQLQAPSGGTRVVTLPGSNVLTPGRMAPK